MSDSTLAPIEDKKVLKTLGSFTRDELARFRNYITSSYFNSKGPLIQFLDVLIPMLKEGKTPRASQMLKLLIRTARLSTASYRSLFMDLTRLVQDFLQNERYKGKPEQAVSDLLTAVKAKRLNKLFEINMSLARKLQSNISSQSNEFYLRQFVIASTEDFQKSLAIPVDKESAAAVMDRLDEYYIINKLRYCCAAKHFKKADDKEADVFLLAEILGQTAGDSIHPAPLRSLRHAHDGGRYSPSVRVYAAIYRMLYGDDDEEQFGELKGLLKRHQKDISEVILRDAYVFAINYCVAKVNKGQVNYLREVYDLYRIALDKKFLYDENELSPWDFSNIMALGIQLKDINWSEKLIEVYKERIPNAGQKMNVVTFNMAKMYFFSGRYAEVLSLLSGVKSTELMYALGSHALLIKTYYEMGDQDELHHQLAGFKASLRRRKKIEDAERQNYLRFIDYTAQLAHINEGDKAAVRKLKQAISHDHEAAEYEWLMEKSKTTK